MDFTFLSRTGLRVSRLCLGTMNFGPRTSEEDAHAIMDIAHEAGINFFDTANRSAASRADRHRHQGLRRDGELAQQRAGCRR